MTVIFNMNQSILLDFYFMGNYFLVALYSNVKEKIPVFAFLKFLIRFSSAIKMNSNLTIMI